MTSRSTLKYLADIELISGVPTAKKYGALKIDEYPFDGQLLSLSPLYRSSRKLYAELNGSFRARVCSTMRSLSATDLFKDEIEYTPSEAEILWLKDHHKEIFDAGDIADALETFNGISLFHEQNHRIIWRLIPRVPSPKNAKDAADVIRYLNFAESLVVTLDLALGDEVGTKLSPSLERLKAIYRPAGGDKWATKKDKEYRQYLRTLFYVTYLILAQVDRRDISKCVDYVFPNQLQMNRSAIKRGLELSELFTQNTNREWQRRYWQQAQKGLSKLQAKQGAALYIVNDPLDFEMEFDILDHVLDTFGVS